MSLAGRTRPGLWVPLWVRSCFSFLEGASQPDELFGQAAELGLPALAITDRDGVHGIVRAHVAARESGVRLLCGADVTLDDNSRITLLVRDREGWANLCRLLTRGRLRSPKGRSSVRLDEVLSHAAGLTALWGGDGSSLLAPEDPTPTRDRLLDTFGTHLWAILARHRRPIDVDHERRTRERIAGTPIRLVATPEVLYHTPDRRPLQDILTCIRHGRTLHDVGSRIRPSAEWALLPPERMLQRYDDERDALRNTFEVAEACTFSMADLRYRYPSVDLPNGMTSAQWLRHLVDQGAAGRYPDGVPTPVRKQLDHELAIIDQLDYCGYFLGMHEIVQFCRSRDILCQGRGSAANSSVCYCLGITAVDPVALDLLFERFLSLERAEPPDIDLDIAHERREEVIQWVYRTHGRTHAAMVANLIRYRPRSAVRDVGKALGLPATSLDRLSRLLGYSSAPSPDTLRAAGLDPELPVHRLLLERTAELLDFPRHLSIHPGGFLLGHEPVHDLVPIEPATMPGRTVIQWDKYDVEELGLFKVDLLGLGALAMVDRCFHTIEQTRGVRLSLHELPHDDPTTWDMIGRGDTVGVFQIESRAQMAMLPRLRPRTFYDVVIEVAIVRPGPISGNMVHPYLRRRNGEEEVTYPHPCLEPVLRKTLGVPLFQEQVMKLAIVAADYTPGEADQLRRDMAAWRSRGKIDQHHDRLVSRMKARGISEEFAERVFQQIRGFGEYGFPESHAASFALIAWATSWLRAHYLPEFTCALLNAQPMGFYSVATIVHDARRHGVDLRPVDVTRSDWDATCEPADAPRGALPPANPITADAPPGTTLPASAADAPPGTPPPDRPPPAVRMGLRTIRGLRMDAWLDLHAARERAPFRSVEDLVLRTRLDERALLTLAEAGALDALLPARRDAAWTIRGALAERDQPLALASRERAPHLAPLHPFELVGWDYRTSAHSVRNHPLGPVRDALRGLGFRTAAEVNRVPDRRRTRYAGIIICRQRPGTAKGVVFATMEDETGFVNLVLWKDVWERYRILVKTAPFLAVVGRVQSADNVVHLLAERLWIPDLDVPLESHRSRDFH